MDYDWDAHQHIENYVFEDTLTYVTWTRGRSSVKFEFKRTDGRMVGMFVSDFSDILRDLVDGKIKGKFTFAKRGANYGCMRITN